MTAWQQIRQGVVLSQSHRGSDPRPGVKLGLWVGLLSILLGWGLEPGIVQAQGAEKAPAPKAPAMVVSLLAQMDQAASQQNLAQFVQAYSPNFRHEDGFDKQALAQSLERFWNQYPNLTYQTELVSWTNQEQGGVAETLTRITGSRQENGREFRLQAQLRSRQTFEGDRLVRQEVLSEESTVTTGANPPQLTVNLPNQVKAGGAFDFDVIVNEPLKSDLLLGGVLDEPVSADLSHRPGKVEVQPLIDGKTGTGPGGLFKVGRAPREAKDRWISAVIVRKDGITMVSRRLNVVAP